ncbi:MAG: hypothetical protein JO250_15110, partial [Armatimonadetes bacterium]|nr:hypothetical protein [Armatimonadota bacterium]
VNPWRIAEGSMPWDDVQKWLQHPSPPEGVAVVGMIAGAAITGALSLLRPRFVGFPWG